MKLYISVILLILSPSLLPQQTDSLIISDTLYTPADSSALGTGEGTYDVDTVIYANASDSLIFNIKQKELHIYGDGNLKYKSTDLKSANISVDFETNDIDAEGIPSDTARKGFIGTPVLSERGEVYEGERMVYNFKTGRGRIAAAGTVSEGAIYTGSKINKVDEETYFIADGIYTTCDADTPHYHFYAGKMKVIHKEQIIAKWIWLHLGQVPFPVPIPFAVFPTDAGRRSGILPPAFGSSGQFGNYFSNFGYFWAISDYMDWNVTADYYTRGSYNLNSRFRYAERYNFAGNLEGGYTFRKIGESTDPNRSRSTNWRIRWNHNQTINPSSRFDANLEFTSGRDYLTQSTTNFGDLLRNDIRSNAVYYKTFESGNSLSASYSRSQNLETGDIREVLPSVSFRVPQTYPFRDKGGEEEWYELIGFNYAAELRNNRNKTGGRLESRGAINHTFSTAASPKIGYFNISPNFNYNERWYNKKIERQTVFNTETNRYEVVTRDINEINMVRTFSTGVSASTRFFGMFTPGVAGIAAIRHTVMPSVSYSYTPDFSKPGWGYYGIYSDSLGQSVRYNLFERELFGGISQGEAQMLNFNVDNNIEMKTAVDPTDTTSKESKIQLLNFGGGFSYNFSADSVRFSDININFRTQIENYLNLSGGTTFSLYDYDENGRNLRRFLSQAGKGFARLTNFNLSLSTSLSGERLKSAGGDEDDIAGLPEEEYALGRESNVYRGLFDDREADFSIPWDVSLAYTIRINKPTPAQLTRYQSINGNFNFNLTPSWKFSMSGSYDLEQKQFAAPQIRISRDLHCWIMNFTWTPTGTFRGYRLEVRVKASQLQDLKLTKTDNFYSGK